MRGRQQKTQGFPGWMVSAMRLVTGTMTELLVPAGMLYLPKNHGLLPVLPAHMFAPFGLFAPLVRT